MQKVDDPYGYCSTQLALQPATVPDFASYQLVLICKLSHVSDLVHLKTYKQCCFSRTRLRQSFNLSCRQVCVPSCLSATCRKLQRSTSGRRLLIYRTHWLLQSSARNLWARHLILDPCQRLGVSKNYVTGGLHHFVLFFFPFLFLFACVLSRNAKPYKTTSFTVLPADVHHQKSCCFI